MKVTVVSTQDVEAPVLVETTGSRPKPLFCDVHGLGEEGPPHVPTAAERPMAFSSGGDLLVERSAPTTLTAALLRTASECPQKGLTIYDSSGQQWDLVSVVSRTLFSSSELRTGSLSVMVSVSTSKFIDVIQKSCCMCESELWLCGCNKSVARVH